MTERDAAAPEAPGVTVVMPAFDAEPLIGAAIASVLAQTWQDFELIVVDDGSTDGTARQVAQVSDQRCRLVTQSNAGPSASRNRGVAMARGEFVAFIDADDLWMPDKLARQVAALRADSDAGVAYGWVDYMTGDDRKVCGDQRATFAGDVLAPLVAHNFIVSGSNVMVRRSALSEVGGFDESLRAVEDWELHVRLAARYRFVCVPEVVTRYRLSANSVSADVALMERSYREASGRVFATLPAALRDLDRRSAASFYRYLSARATDGGFSLRRWLTAARFAAKSAGRDPIWFLKSLRVAPLRLAARLAGAVLRR